MEAERVATDAGLATLAAERTKFESWRRAAESDIASQQSVLSAANQSLLTREAAVSNREHEVEARRKKLEAALA